MNVQTCRWQSMVTHRLGLLTVFAALGSQPVSAQCTLQPSALGAGRDGSVWALATYDADGTGPNPSKLYAGGIFDDCIASWDGSAWTTISGGLTCLCGHPDLPHVSALAVFDDDGPGPNPHDLYVGGFFVRAGTVDAENIVRWDGSSWSPLGSGTSAEDLYGVIALTVSDDDGNGPHLPALYAGGDFLLAGGMPANFIAKWDGSSWSQLGSGMNQPVWALTSWDDDGAGPHPPALYAGGYFTTAGGVNASYVAKWDGSSWSDLGGGMDAVVLALTVFDDDGAGPNPRALYAAGEFTTAGGVSAERVARWDGSGWTALGSGVDARVRTLAVFDGDGAGPELPALYAGGHFTTAGGVGADSIARWDGATWSAVGTGTDGIVYALAGSDVDGAGLAPSALYAAGFFDLADGVPAEKLAQWSGCGSSIQPFCVGDGMAGPCPCGNTGLLRHGCNNSAGTGGALLTALGNASLSDDTLVFESSGELPSALSIFLQGTVEIAPIAYGDGLRCTGGALRRLFVKNASSGTALAPQAGDPTVSLRSTQRGDPLFAGATRHYQVYYRDPDMSFCPSPLGNTFNISNGRSVSWGP